MQSRYPLSVGVVVYCPCGGRIISMCACLHAEYVTYEKFFFSIHWCVMIENDVINVFLIELFYVSGRASKHCGGNHREFVPNAGQANSLA